MRAARNTIAITIATAFALGACQPGKAPTMQAGTDDFGDSIMRGAKPSRVVSLNPATTDLIFALGGGERLVGRTHWDHYPPAADAVPDMGSGLRPNVEVILAARPDLVVLYASADNRAAARELRAAGVNTLSLKIDSIAEFHRASRMLGILLGDSARGAAVSDSVAKTLKRVQNATASLPKPKVFWHIWSAPLITVARGSYMNELVELAGATNIYGDLPDASPMVSIEDVLKRDPQIILTGPDGASKIRSDPRWSQSRAVKSGSVLVVDTTLVGRPSVRLGEAAAALARLLHPGLEIR